MIHGGMPMQMNQEQFHTFQDVDIRTIHAKDLVQIKDIHINPTDSREKRIADTLQQMKNPYLLASGEAVIKISYAKNTNEANSIEDCLYHLLHGC